MLATRDLQVDAEEHSSGQSSIWRNVYKTMRCTGPPCNKGPYCWCDPDGKMHYKLHTDTMTSLVEYVEDGHTLETHDDVPKDIREQLYVEERQAVERHQKASRSSAVSLPPIPITITVLPAPSDQTSHLVSLPAAAPDMPLKSTLIDRLNIPGPRDEAVEEYCAWQKS
jgi:hypothetical protein